MRFSASSAKTSAHSVVKNSSCCNAESVLSSLLKLSEGNQMKLFFVVLSIVIALIANANATSAQTNASPAILRHIADDYYNWRNRNYPVSSSDAVLHTWDDKLTDYSPAAIEARRQHARSLLAQVNSTSTAKWKKDDRIDWLLFRAQLEGVVFFDRVMDFEHSDAQTYVNECSNAIFSLIKKEYDTPRIRALSATARLQAMPAMIEQGKRNLTKPVKLYAQLAIDSARPIDSLLKDSMITAPAKDLSPPEMKDLVSARDAAIRSIHSYAGWLEKRAASMPPFAPMGEANYNYLLKHVYLLPLDAKQVEMLGQTELARARAMESMLPDPSLADPNPARAKIIPKDQDDFLKAYESREAEMI